jgi:hypothetical protein
MGSDGRRFVRYNSGSVLEEVCRNMPEFGLTIKAGDNATRIQVTCPHQSGLLYLVPAERSWVCSREEMPSHALAGFFRELVALGDSRVQELMQLWGIYYRQLPLEGEHADDSPAAGA